MADPAPAAAAKPKRSRNTPRKSDHPKYSEMVLQAIASENARGGSSRQYIQKYIKANFKVGDNVNKQVRLAVVRMTGKGLLRQVTGTGASGSFSLVKKVAPKSMAKKATTPKKGKTTKKPAAAKKTVGAKKAAAPKKATTPKKPAAAKKSPKKSPKKTPKKTTKKSIKSPKKSPAKKTLKAKKTTVKSVKVTKTTTKKPKASPKKKTAKK